MLDNDKKEVLFVQYCPLCKYKDQEEEEEPCFECLAEPLNIDSHKPINWEEK